MSAATDRLLQLNNRCIAVQHVVDRTGIHFEVFTLRKRPLAVALAFMRRHCEAV